MKYPFGVHEVAIVKTTGEPVYVLAFSDDTVIVRRGVQREAGGGFEYVEEGFKPGELLSEKDNLLRELEFQLFSVKEKEKANEDYMKYKQSLKPKAAEPFSPLGGNLPN